MAPNVFSVTVFLLVFRETLEAAVIISVLLGLVKQIVYDDTSPLHSIIDENQPAEGDADDATRKRRLLRKLRIQVRSLRSPYPLALMQLCEGLRWCRSRVFHRIGHWCGFHCRLVHSGIQSLGKI